MSSFEWPPTGGGGGVSSLNGETGDINLVAGTGISITPAGQNITIATSALLTAIRSINSDTTAAQTIVPASTGTDLTILTSGGVTTVAIPSSSASNRGLLTSADWSTFNAKGSGSVTSVGFSVPASSIFAATGSPVTGSGTLGFTTTGVSGGIPYFDTSSTLHTSSILTANQLLVGGGAGSSPAIIGSLGTTTTVLHGNAAGGPTFGAVALTSDVSGTLPVANGGTGIGALTQNSVPFMGATTFAQNNAQFNWDNTNFRLSMGDGDALNASLKATFNTGGASTPSLLISSDTQTASTVLLGPPAAGNYDVVAIAGTLATPTTLDNLGSNAQLGQLRFRTYNPGTTSLATQASIQVKIDGTPLNQSGQPSQMLFNVANGGAATAQMTLHKDGALNLAKYTTAGILHNDTSGNITSSLVVNADVDPAAAIAYSKLALTGSILNADLAGSIAASKLIGSDIATVGTITSGTWAGTTIAVNHGGTGLTAGTSGGIPYYSSTSTIASSGALGSGQLVLGGGAGATPTSVTALPAANFPALTGDVTTSAGSLATTLAATSNATLTSLDKSTGVTVHGTNTNNNAAAGYAGEQMGPISRLRSAAISLTTNTAVNLGNGTTSMTLTAGDWEIRGAVGFKINNTTAVTELDAAVTQTSATFPAAALVVPTSSGEVQVTFGAPITGNNNDVMLPIVPYRVSLSGSATFFLIAQATFTVSTITAYGYMDARRIR